MKGPIIRNSIISSKLFKLTLSALSILLHNDVVHAFSINSLKKTHHNNTKLSHQRHRNEVEDVKNGSIHRNVLGGIPFDEKDSFPFLIQRRKFVPSLVRKSFLASLLLSQQLVIYNAVAETTDEEGCSNGSLAAEGAIPGAYQNQCMSLDERTYTLKSTNDQIKIYQGDAATKKNQNEQQSASSSTSPTTTLAGRTGVTLWNSGLLLSRLLDEIQLNIHSQQTSPSSDDHYERSSKSLLFDQKTILELGCGTGFTSIAASKLGAKYVYATDANPEVLELAKTNLQRNGIYPNSSNNGNDNYVSGGGESCPLQWGSLDSVDYFDVADVVLGSDLTYNSGSWRILVDTIGAVLKPSGYVLYVTLGHSGFNLSGEMNGFLTVVQSVGTLQVVDESSSSWPFPGIRSLESLLLSSLTEDERDTVKSTGGLKILVLQRKQRRIEY